MGPEDTKLDAEDEIAEKILQLKWQIKHQKKIMRDRRDQFKEWDKNSKGLIAQYEEEIHKLKVLASEL